MLYSEKSFARCIIQTFDFCAPQETSRSPFSRLQDINASLREFFLGVKVIAIKAQLCVIIPYFVRKLWQRGSVSLHSSKFQYGGFKIFLWLYRQN